MDSVKALEKTTFCGRRFTRKQLAQVQETVLDFPNLSRTKLAQTICEHLDWKTPTGANKTMSALKLLEELEARNLIKLPAKRQARAPVQRPIPHREEERPIHDSLDRIGPVALQLVTTGEERTLWKSYVDSFHYLGYKRPIGAHLCYFVVSGAGQKLGCVLFSASAAWALAPRDAWIGWQSKQREKLLHLVLSQNRFLVFPWVNVPELSSKILSLATKRVADDWVRVHGYRPVLVETFVDTTKYPGTSYRAANWHYLGETQGRGHDPHHKCDKTRKAIFVYPLQSNWRHCLIEGQQTKALKKRYRNDVQNSRSRSVGDAFIDMWEKTTQILHDVAKEYDDKWRVRKRVLDSLLLMLLIFRLVASKNAQSYCTTIDELWDSCDKLKISLPQKSSAAPSSFCAARKKLDESIFREANTRILAAYASKAGDYTWLGHQLFAVDGSKLNLPRSLVKSGYKTPNDKSHYPQGLLSCLYQVKSQLPYDFVLTKHTDERLCAAQHLDVLHPGDVVVYDRGYFSYVMLHKHHETGVHAVFRLQESSYNVIRDFFAGSQTDVLIEILPSKPTQSDIRKRYPELKFAAQKLRLIKYEVGGTTFCLGTTLLDSKRYPISSLMDVYHARWGVEVLYDASKHHIDIEDFHAKSERGVRQEIYAHFALITMSRLFANQADIDLNLSAPLLTRPERTDVTGSHAAITTTRRIRTNFKNCINVVARSMEELLLVRDRIAAIATRVYRLVIRQHQRNRPGRSYPRISMRPIKKWMSTPKKPKKSQAEVVIATA